MHGRREPTDLENIGTEHTISAIGADSTKGENCPPSRCDGMAPNLNKIQKYKSYVDIRFAKYHYKEYQSTGKNVLNNDRIQKNNKRCNTLML